MQTYRTIPQLKSLARDALIGNFNITVTATIVYVAIYLFVLRVLSPTTNILWLQAGSLIVNLLSGVFLSGFAFMYINVIYGNRASVSQLFHGFKEDADKAILIRLAYVVLALVCNLPLTVYELSAGANGSIIVRLFFAVMIPAVTFIVTIPISQAFFLLQDFPNRRARDLLRASARLMRGNGLRFVLLTLSFLPLFLLCALTLFLPSLWLLSYYRATMAAFYKDLIEVSHGVGTDAGADRQTPAEG